MTQSDWENPPPEPPFACLRCHDIIDEDDGERYAGLCEECYEGAVEWADEWAQRIVRYLEQRLKDVRANSAIGARE